MEDLVATNKALHEDKSVADFEDAIGLRWG